LPTRRGGTRWRSTRCWPTSGCTATAAGRDHSRWGDPRRSCRSCGGRHEQARSQGARRTPRRRPGRARGGGPLPTWAPRSSPGSGRFSTESATCSRRSSFAGCGSFRNRLRRRRRTPEVESSFHAPERCRANRLVGHRPTPRRQSRVPSASAVSVRPGRAIREFHQARIEGSFQSSTAPCGRSQRSFRAGGRRRG
jgi:hypothetical protein